MCKTFIIFDSCTTYLIKNLILAQVPLQQINLSRIYYLVSVLDIAEFQTISVHMFLSMFHLYSSIFNNKVILSQETKVC